MASGPGETFGVRVAGLAVNTLQELRFPRTWAAVDELTAQDAWLAAEGESLSQALYDVIGRNRQPGAKPLLVALRRAVYTGRPVHGLDILRTVLPDDVAHRIDLWRHRRARREALAACLPEVLATELRDRTETLRRLAADEGFRHGLLFSSLTLSAQLSKWLDDPGALPGRPALIRLSRYLARVATKTSPYATFTLSGLGRWSAGGSAVSVPRELSGEIVAELDQAVVRRLWGALARRPELRAAVGVRVNPSLAEHEGRLWFLGAGPHEPLTSVPPVPALEDLLAGVRDLSDPTVAAVDRLAGAPEPVDRLLEAGLLERRPPYTDQAADPLGDLLAWLRRSLPADTPDRSYLLATLDELHRLLHAPAGRPDVRRRAVERMRELASNALEHLGTAGPVGKTLCLDTAVSPRHLAICSRPAWQPVLGDLQLLRRLCAVFDPDGPIKAAAADFFLCHFGEPVPFMRLYQAAHAFGAELRALLHGQDTPRRTAHAALRRQTWEALYGGPQDIQGVIVVDGTLIGKLTATWPDHLRAPDSICCYGQAVSAPDGIGLALNTVYSGYGRHTGRIRHLLGRAGDAIYPVLECRGAFGTNLNLRPAAATGIDYPFTSSDAGTLLTDLWVSHDAASGRLVLTDESEQRLHPMHTGMSSELMLPPAWMFLIRVFGEPPIAMPLRHWPSTSTGPVAHRPRLQIGRVVLTRAAWRMRANAFPVPEGGEGEAAYLLRLARWLADHRIPRCFFARLTPARAGRAASKYRKPLYVDVRHHFLLLSLTRSLRDPDDVLVLEEALPHPADAPRYGAHGRRVTEYVFEVGA
ncbi:lantibiotic dehydratase [Nonomuraea sp. NPDC001699]